LACDWRRSETREGDPVGSDDGGADETSRMAFFDRLAFSLQAGAIVALLLRTSVDANQLGAANPLNTIATGFVLLIVLVLACPC